MLLKRKRAVRIARGRPLKSISAYLKSGEDGDACLECRVNLTRTFRSGKIMFEDMIGIYESILNCPDENVVAPSRMTNTEEMDITGVERPSTSRFNKIEGIGSVSFHINVADAPIPPYEAAVSVDAMKCRDPIDTAVEDFMFGFGGKSENRANLT